MSTRSTIILTDCDDEAEDEHWYHEMNGASFYGTKTQQCMVLELNECHKITRDEDGKRIIIIEEDTDLYKAIEYLKAR